MYHCLSYIHLQEIADLQKELAAEAAANEAKRVAEIEALAREQEEMRLTLAQLDPVMLELAAPAVKNAQKLERRAEAVDVVFDMYADSRACKFCSLPRLWQLALFSSDGVLRLIGQGSWSEHFRRTFGVWLHSAGSRSVSWTFRPRKQRRLPQRRWPWRTNLVPTMAAATPRGSAKSNGQANADTFRMLAVRLIASEPA